MPKKSLLPFIVLAGGFVWYGIFAWLRRRKGVGIQTADPLLLWGVLGLLAAMITAGIFAVLQWR